jgi:ABC-type uncharacterized transport system auxiliary subunit
MGKFRGDTLTFKLLQDGDCIIHELFGCKIEAQRLSILLVQQSRAVREGCFNTLVCDVHICRPSTVQVLRKRREIVHVKKGQEQRVSRVHISGGSTEVLNI